jgi:16S rRNA (guanine1207-N2)-methyltransferase
MQSHYFIDDPTLPDDFKHFAFYFHNLSFKFTSNSGVFSHGHVDPESDLLLRQIPPLQGTLLDLGCGCGVIGIALCKAYNLSITLADVNPRALKCAEINCQINDVKANILSSDGFEQIPDKFNTITLNPPIHAGKKVLHRLFAGAKEHLAEGGAFYIVILEKHGAKITARHLQEVFGVCEVLYKKKGEYVLRCKNNIMTEAP